MTLNELSDGLRRLSLIRHRKIPDAEELEVWHDRVGHINSIAWKTIVDELLDASTTPISPQAVKNAYFQWLEQHPEKRERVIKEVTRCDDCLDSGYLRYGHDVPGQGFYGQFLANCGACNNGERYQHCPTYTRDEIVAKGWVVTGPDDALVEKALRHETRKPYRLKPRSERDGKLAATGEVIDALLQEEAPF